MLIITIPATEMWNEKTEEFFTVPSYELRLEHSLVALSKWESKWEKPFLSNKDKTGEELLDYIKCMTINKQVDDAIYNRLTRSNISQIREYIESPMTATTFSNKKEPPSREIVTAELIYYWMIALNIPFECQKWHINRLLTLIKVCNIKNQPPKKMSQSELASRNAALNAARRKRLKSKG